MSKINPNLPPKHNEILSMMEQVTSFDMASLLAHPNHCQQSIQHWACDLWTLHQILMNWYLVWALESWSVQLQVCHTTDNKDKLNIMVVQGESSVIFWMEGGEGEIVVKVVIYQVPISFPELRSPWPAVGKRELWEQPFQACAIAWNRCRLRLRSEPENQNSVISHCYFKMDPPRTLVFRPLVKGNEALGTRLAKSKIRRNVYRGI